ncbi:hypothetical protein G3I40_13475 [Streptomyces sp. SID14478]|uniref:hypothetical protein n=1 Tax=Streptomyces sp. SID14478 TaxID=2706073 RepID=UPI0013D9E200|nr:hypothetical protein [Streptomyces sp. SID14478]NEB76224.1 hypothetical protein [Streptomyces sp. SID14478]
MPTTRHTLNRQRRLAQRPPEPETPAQERLGQPARLSPQPRREQPGKAAPERRTRVRTDAPGRPERTKQARTDTPERTKQPRRTLLAVLSLLTLLLGGFAGWAYAEAHALDDDAATRNTALTDAARTSEIKGQAGKAVNALFSYDYANPGAEKKAAATYLTGKAVTQHRTLLAPVLTQADKQKTVVTTTVTDSAVERIDGDRARVLVFADQSSTSTAAKAKDAGNYAGAMLAVDLVHRDGRWLVSALDTFGNG